MSAAIQIIAFTNCDLPIPDLDIVSGEGCDVSDIEDISPVNLEKAI